MDRMYLDKTPTELFYSCVVANARALFIDFPCDAGVKPGTLYMEGKHFTTEL